MSDFIKWINLLAFWAMIIVNVLANLIPLGGHTTGQVSAEYQNLFTPAPFTFAIWAIIYLFMAVYSFMQLGMSDTNMSLIRVRSAIRILFILSCAFNIAWIFCWHYSKIGLSVICMLLLLVTLIIINMRLTIVPNASVFERITVYGFNIYLGWITAATIANISVFLTKIKWSGFGLSSVIWTLIVISVGTLIAVGFVMIGRRYFAAVAVMWAYFGIFMRQISPANTMSKITVAVGAMVAIVVILACIIISAMLPQVQNQTQ